jgi:hypothetical protein
VRTWEEIREDFPILKEKVYGKDLIYLDNAATTQLPQQVLNCFMEHYTKYNANVHRGIHYLSEQSTMHMEAVRGDRFIQSGGSANRKYVRSTYCKETGIRYGDSHFSGFL